MLDVARALKESSPHALIVVAGAGDAEAEVHATVLRENLPIRMLGWRSDVEQIFAACDSVLLTSDNEGTPLSLIQAGLAGIPVVSTDVGSVREIVVDGRTGLLTKTSPTALARNLESLAGDPKKSAEMGRSAQEWTQANYGVDRLVRDHERMYEELLG
jgi:glycosyltransferase involved in cell wall biosynthesis